MSIFNEISQQAEDMGRLSAGLPLAEVREFEIGKPYKVLRPGHHLDGKIGTLEYISGDDGHLQFSDCAICGTPLSTLQAMGDV